MQIKLDLTQDEYDRYKAFVTKCGASSVDEAVTNEIRHQLQLIAEGRLVTSEEAELHSKHSA